MFTGIEVALFIGVVGLLPSSSHQNPYRYYAPYSRPRRDPAAAAWQSGYAPVMPQMNPVLGSQRAGYGGAEMDRQLGMGMGQQYGVNQYSPMSMGNPLKPVMGGMESQQQLQESRPQPRDGAPDHVAQRGQQVVTPPVVDVPSEPGDCKGVTCDDLANCIKVAINDSSCCPKCTEYGCVCDGYQKFDCMLNGYRDGMLPERKSYKFAAGTKVCTCPPGGGAILCSAIRDSTTSRCPDLLPNCIEPFDREIDGCQECAKVGCVGDDGVKVEAGSTVNRPSCLICYCPENGGTMMCGVDPSCNQGGQQQTGNLALQSTLREVNSFGQSREATMYGYSPYGGGYPDYGSQFPMTGEEGPVEPPLAPVGSDSSSQTGANSNGPESEATSQDAPSGGYNQYAQQQGYGVPYQNPYPYLDYGGQYAGNGFLGPYGAAGYPKDPYSATGFSNAQADKGTQQQQSDGSTGSEQVSKPMDASHSLLQKSQNQPGSYAVGQNYDPPSLAAGQAEKQQSQRIPTLNQQGQIQSGNSLQSGQGYPNYPMQDPRYQMGNAGGGQQGYGSSSRSSGTDASQQQSQGKVPGGNGIQYGLGYSGYPMPSQLGGQFGALTPGNDPRQHQNQGAISDSASSQAAENSQSADSGRKPFERQNTGSQTSSSVDPYRLGAVNPRLYPGGQPPYQPRYPFAPSATDQGSRSDSAQQSKPQDSSLDDGQSQSENTGTSEDIYGISQLGGNSGRDDTSARIQNPGVSDPRLAFNAEQNRMQQQGPYRRSGQFTPGLMAPDDSEVNPRPRPTPPAPFVDPSLSRRLGRNSQRMVVRGRAHHEPKVQPTTTTTAATTTSRRTTTTTATPPTTTTTTTTTTRPTTTTTTTPKPTTTTTTTKPPTTTTTTTTKRTTTTTPTTTTTTTTRPTTTTTTTTERPTTTTRATTTTRTTRSTTTRPVTKSVAHLKPSRRIKGLMYAEQTVKEDERLLMECCSHGRIWANSHDSCSGITRRMSRRPELCFSAQKQCCEEARNDNLCEDGINLARTTGSCARPSGVQASCQSDSFKTCCDCCQMGLRARDLGMSCETRVFDQSCGKAYTSCCQQGGAVRQSSTGASVTDSTTSLTTTTTTVSTTTTPKIILPRCATHNTCQQICVDTNEGMLCSCRRGYKLQRDRISCADINECVVGTHTCTENQLCLNRQGSFFCQRRLSCGTGYELTSRNTCDDIDECDLGVHNCLPATTCRNLRGSFECIPKKCDAGFITDATGRCIDINECRIRRFNCPIGASCINTEGSYECQCPVGLTPNDENTRCEDIDECRLSISDCSERGICVNTIGSYICREPPKLRCARGYVGDEETNSCVDIDECTAGTHSCKAGSTCINEVGGYRCQDPLNCPEGMKPSEDERVCVDINECENASLHRCDIGGMCLNLMGSFKCRCSDGYENGVSPEGLPTCEDIDECTMRVGRKCKYQCRNLPGSYECACPEGYRTGSSRTNCEDIDECASSPCPASETCFNTQGSYKCKDLSCPAGYKRYSNTRRTYLGCQPRCSARVCDAPRLRFIHVVLPEFPLASSSQPQLILRMRKSLYSTVDYRITRGNEENYFTIGVTPGAGELRAVRPLFAPWEGVLEIEISQTSSFARRTGLSVLTVYVFVQEHPFSKR